MIYTLDYLEKEANTILEAWNGSDETFVDGNGETRNQDDIDHAKDLLNYVDSIKAITRELSI